MLHGMFVAGYGTQGNFSCNFCRNKIARQVEGKIAHCNVSLIKYERTTSELDFFFEECSRIMLELLNFTDHSLYSLVRVT